MAMLQAEDTPVAIVVIDIDHFKNINDRYGHAAGDRALQRLAKQMVDSARASDTLARAGGERIRDAAAGRAHGRRGSRGTPAAPENRDSPNPDLSAHPITLSAGVAHYPTHGATLEAVYQRGPGALLRQEPWPQRRGRRRRPRARRHAQHPALKTDSRRRYLPLPAAGALRLLEQRAAGIALVGAGTDQGQQARGRRQQHAQRHHAGAARRQRQRPSRPRPACRTCPARIAGIAGKRDGSPCCLA